MTVACQSCGAVNAAEARFCQQCGRALGATGSQVGAPPFLTSSGPTPPPAQTYRKVRVLRTTFVVLGWICIVLAPLAVLASVVATIIVATQSRAGPEVMFFAIVGIIYAAMFAVYALMLFGCAEWATLSLDTEEQVRAIRQRLG